MTPPRDGSISAVADALRARGIRVCSFERLDGTAPPTFDAPDGPPEALLDAAVAAHPGYVWSRHGPLVRLAPEDSLLDRPTPPVEADGAPLATVLADVGAAELALWGGPGDPVGPPVTLALGAATVGDVLDAAVLGLGRSVWHVSGQPGAYALTITEVEAA